MQKRQLLPPVILLITSFLLMVFASLGKLEHWNILYFYLSSGLAVFIFLVGVYIIFKIARK